MTMELTSPFVGSILLAAFALSAACAGGASVPGSTGASSVATGGSGSTGSTGSAMTSSASGSVAGTIGVEDAGHDGTPDSGPSATLDGGKQEGGSALGGDAGSTDDPSKKITVWIAGDSTNQPCTTTCPCGWGSQFQAYLTSNATVVDSAVGGRSIQTWLYDPNVTTTMGPDGECEISPKVFSARWQAMLDATSGMKPGDYLMVEFGINDSDPTCNRHVGTALFQTYLEMMAQAAQARGARPVFLTSTDAIICNGNSVTQNRGFGPETKAAGMASNVPVIDLTALTATFYGSLGFCPNDGDFTSTTTALGTFFCDDHTHFEAAGAGQIAGVVAKALRDQKIGLATYLK
jgi:lysophospholipase L1-like esterase